MLINPYIFQHAKAVWQSGAIQEMNQTLLFKTSIPSAKDTHLALACSTGYVLYVNGEFVAVGPARTAHGYHRVDVLKLDSYLTKEENIVSIHVTGANVNNYSCVIHDSFLCAEIKSGETVLAYTDCKQSYFVCGSYPERVQKVPRYSEQRLFAEVYRLQADSILKDTKMDVGERVSLQSVEHGTFISRDVYYADYELIPGDCIISCGQVCVAEPEKYKIPVYYSEGMYRERVCEKKLPFISYPMEDTEILPAMEAQKFRFSHSEFNPCNSSVLFLQDKDFADIDFGYNATGLLAFSVHCHTDVKLYLLFDEILDENKEIDFLRPMSANVLIWELEAGNYSLVTSEPYTMRYLRAVSLEGECEISDLALRRIGFPKVYCALKESDEKLQAIFRAAVETFRQNAYDIYMDCPSRERAGWLCDSFFTARAEHLLSGKTVVERAFLTNFLLAEKVPFHPQEMLPMAYPAEQMRVRFIPNWAMWYVLELEEYFHRSGDRELIDAAKPKLDALLSYFRTFENEYGLLEKLDNWVFVEWSEANKLVQDVNFPTNMLYARMKQALAHLYGDNCLLDEAEDMKKQIVTLSQNGLFFCDNAFRKDGKLVLSGEHTETCQYYAFFCGTVTPKSHPDLWNTMLNDFGPVRSDRYPHIHPSNAFIGHYLRLDLLCTYGETERLLENIKDYFYKMACTTGTLWEHDTTRASCCHGFTSCIIYWMNKLGKLTFEESTRTNS